MGFISLPENVSHQQYTNWLSTPAGQSYIRPIQAMADRGMSVSHAPPASAFRPPAQGAGGSQRPFNRPSTAGQTTPLAGSRHSYFTQGQRPTSGMQGSGASVDLSAYSPGQARPRVDGSDFSTPYTAWRTPGSQNTVPESYSPQRQESTARQPMGDAMLPPGWSFGPNGERLRPGQTLSPSPQTPAQPTPDGGDFQFQPGFYSTSRNFDGSVSSQPDYAFRDAFVSSINDAMFPYYANSGTYLGEGAPPDSWGQAPSLDFNQLMSQSRDMVSGGWTNPFLSQMAQSPLAGLFG